MTRDRARTLHRRDTATKFVGRRRELAELIRLLSLDDRLVTLIGPGGIGKTRLAVRIARLRADRDGEVVFVDLAPLCSEARVHDALLRAVDPDARPRGSALASAAALLGQRRALVVLDNCEHMADTAARAAHALLEECPNVRILATTREPLRVPGEVVWPVPPLAVPAAPGDPPRPGRHHSDAAELFVDRARLARRDVPFPNSSLGDVDRIVRAVDGIPLAIELAAARVRMLGIREIADTLNLHMLSDGRRGGDTRHRTMRSSLEWSYDLLSPPERLLFRRLGVFRGSWTADGAVAVCADDRLPAADIPRHLTALVDKTLVVRRTSVPGARFRMLLPIREFAAEPPDETDDPAVRAAVDPDALATRHLQYYADLAEQAARAHWPLEREGRAALDDAAPNLHAALLYACGHRPGDALRLAAALGFYWRMTGRLAEGADATARALSVAPGGDPAVRATALANRSALLYWLGDLSGALAVAVTAIETAADTDDGTAQAHALVRHAAARSAIGAEGAEDLMREALARARETGDPVLLSDALVALTLALMWREDFAAMAPVAEECVDVAARLDFAHAEALARWCQAYAALTRLDLDTVRQLADRMAELTSRSTSTARYYSALTFNRNTAVQLQAILAIHEGAPENALALLRDELARCADAPVPWGVGALILARGHAELALGDHTAATVTGALLHEQDRTGAHPLNWRAYEILMLAALGEGDGHTARTHAAEIRAIGKKTGNRTAKAAALNGVARADLLAGDPGSAELHAREALAVARAADLPAAAGTALDVLAAAAVARGTLDRAVTLTAAADTIAGPRVTPPAAAARDAVLEAVRDGLDAAAQATAHAEGSAMTLDAAEAYVRRTRGRRVRADRGWASLTGTEAAVARLAADGLLNPAIAERLVVARGTVKVHLSRVYAKLGVANRTELAAYLREFPPP